jgi:hypothetical protein
LSELNQILTEENRLLRDFAYGVDPSAGIIHMHRFTEQSDSRNLMLNNNSEVSSSALGTKITEFITKYGQRR